MTIAQNKAEGDEKHVKGGYYRRAGDIAYFYQCNFNAILVLVQILDCTEMLKKQISEKDINICIGIFSHTIKFRSIETKYALRKGSVISSKSREVIAKEIDPE